MSSHAKQAESRRFASQPRTAEDLPSSRLSAATAPIPQGELPAAITNLGSTLENALQDIRRLHQRLHPVLRPEPSDASGKPEIEHPLSPITGQILEIEIMARAISYEVRQIEDHLAL